MRSSRTNTVSVDEMAVGEKYLRVGSRVSDGLWKTSIDTSKIYLKNEEGEVRANQIDRPTINHWVENNHLVENADLMRFIPFPIFPKPYDEYLTEDDEFILESHLPMCKTNEERQAAVKAYLHYLKDFN